MKSNKVSCGTASKAADRSSRAKIPHAFYPQQIKDGFELQ